MTSSEIISCFRNCKVLDRAYQISSHRPSLLAWDTETTGLDRRAQVFGLSVCFEEDGVFYTSWARKESHLYPFLLGIIKDTPKLVAHNARFDIRMMQQTHKLDLSRTDCTYTMSRIVNDRRLHHGLKEIIEWLCPEFACYEDEINEERKRIARETKRHKDEVGFDEVPDSVMSKYAMLDSFLCLMVYKHYWPTIEAAYREVYEREKKIYILVNKVEAQGLRYSARKSLRHAREMNDEAEIQLKTLQRLTIDDAFNPNSPPQVLSALRFLGVPDKLLTDKGKTTTGADILRQNLEKFPQKAKDFTTALLDYRALTKLVNTYLLPLAERAKRDDGYIYCEINPSDARTGRMASRNPNLQNIPTPVSRKTEKTNPVRACFTCAPDEAIYYFDNEQMEMAYFGMLTDCDVINKAYAAGEDLHMATARQIYSPSATKEQRSRTKAVNFGVIYGIGIQSLARNNEWPLNDARDFLEEYHGKLPEISAFQDRCKWDIKNYGYVADMWGKRYHIKEPYKAVNARVQGGCAQVFKEQMLAVDSFLSNARPSKYNAKIVMPAHDEIQIRTHRALVHDKSYEGIFCNCIIKRMSDIPRLLDRGLRMRISCERTVTSWAAKKKVAL